MERCENVNVQNLKFKNCFHIYFKQINNYFNLIFFLMFGFRWSSNPSNLSLVLSFNKITDLIY